MPAKTIDIDGEQYEIPTRQGTLITEHLIYAWEKLGKPTDPFSKAGKKLVDVVIATWEDTYPSESWQWKRQRDEHLGAEMEIKEQIRKGTGRTLASYPYYIWILLKRLFPTVKFQERKTAMKMVKNWQIFKYVNKV